MSEQQIMELAEQIAAKSKRGMWYDGENSTNLIDWLAEGDEDHIKSSTIDELVLEWDE